MFVEQNPKAADCIRENLKTTRLEESAAVMVCDVMTALRRMEGKQEPFDLVFMDPPYGRDLELEALSYLKDSSLIHPDTLIVVEASLETKSEGMSALGYTVSRVKTYKDQPAYFSCDLGTPETAGRSAFRRKNAGGKFFVYKGEKWNMATAIYPGSFDPVTLGHLDIIERTAQIMDRVIVGVLNNRKKTPLFSVEERVNMLKSVTSHLENVEVKAFDGLTIDFARENGAKVIVRGLRAITDFEYELQLSQTNRVMAPEIDTLFLTTSLKYSYLSSSMVKEIAVYGGDISAFLPAQIARLVQEKVKSLDKKG